MAAGSPRTTDAVVPVAGPAHHSGVLGGPARPATVLTSGTAAAYLRLDTGPGGPRAHGPVVLAVVAADAVAVPCALLLPAGREPRRLLGAGDRVLVGEGSVACPAPAGGGRRLVVHRWWSPPPLPHGLPDPAATARLSSLLTTAPATSPAQGAARAAAPVAAAALAAGDARAATRALRAVLGLGPGSTPSGDDVAAGVLLAARSTGTPPGVLDPVEAAVSTAAHGATGAVSAALLRDAAAGRCATVVAAAVDALLGRRPPQPAFGALLALGHTSGADLATGLLAVAAAARRGSTTATCPPDPDPTTEDVLMGTAT